MRSPSLTTYLLGNLIVLIGSWIVTAIVTYRWLTGDAPGLLALICFVFACSSFQASDRITKFNRWQREWNRLCEPGMNKASFRLPRIPGLNLLALFVGWPMLLLNLTRRSGTTQAPVSLCAIRPWLSPDLTKAYAALPEYCAQLAQTRPGAQG